MIRPITNASPLIPTRRRPSIDSRVWSWVKRYPMTAIALVGWSVMIAYLTVYIVSGAYRA